MNDDVRDQRDLSAASAGDDEAFARLYDRHAALVLSCCRRAIPGSMAEAEDAMQETFLRAHRRLDRLREASSLRGWLCAIARRVCSERRRSALRRRRHEDLAMLEMKSYPPRASAAPERVEHDEDLDRLSEAIDRLDERERLAVHLFYLDRDPVRAAATALGLSRSGYYKLLSRARARLASIMQQVQTS